MPRRARRKLRDPGHGDLVRKIEAGQPWIRPDHDLEIDLKLFELLTGFDHFGAGFASLAETRAAWEVAREPFLEAHVEHRPGTRPWAWWKYDAPEPRRMLEGSPERVSPVAEMWLGMPSAHACKFESEPAYLERLALWYDRERSRCRAAWAVQEGRPAVPGQVDTATSWPAELPDTGTMYALGVVAGTVPACRAIKRACQRHLDDLDDAWRRGLWYDWKAASYRLMFSRYVRHYQGPSAGNVFEPQPWQCFVTGSTFGWMTAENWRRFSSAFVFLPRKSGKTLMAAVDALFCLIADGESAPEIKSVATKIEQASKCIIDAAGIRAASPLIRSATRAARLNIVGPKWVACDSTRGMFRPLTSDSDSELGGNLTFAVVDEAAVHADDSNARQVEDSMSARAQQKPGDIGTGGGPMLLVITSAGRRKDAFGGQEYDLGQKVLDPDDETTVETHFVFIAELDDVIEDGKMIVSAREAVGDKPPRWRDEGAWPEANPNVGISRSYSALKALVAKAIADPGKLPALLIYHFNLWEAGADAWLPWHHWIRCQARDVNAISWRRQMMQDLEGERCFGGLDLADRYDMNAFVLYFPDAEPRPVVLPWYWIPEDNMRERAKRDHVPYPRWVETGFLSTTPGRSTDFAWIAKDIVGAGDSFKGSLMERFEIEGVWCDPWRVRELKDLLTDGGLECHICRPQISSLSEPSEMLEGLVRSEGFDHGGHPILSWNARNAVAVTRPDGSIMPNKGKAQTQRIDGISAWVDALRGVIDSGADEDPAAAWREERDIREAS